MTRALLVVAALQLPLLPAPASPASPRDQQKADQERQDKTQKAIDRLNKLHGITTDGPQGQPGATPRALAEQWAEALSKGNQRGLLGLIAPDKWLTCASDALAAERGRAESVARSLGGLSVEAPRGVKLAKAEALGKPKTIKAGGDIDGCTAATDVTIQRWRFELRKPDRKTMVEEYELIASGGRWALRAK
jgi:hypothetical protein